MLGATESCPPIPCQQQDYPPDNILPTNTPKPLLFFWQFPQFCPGKGLSTISVSVKKKKNTPRNKNIQG
jgi:hypothetical protein